MIYTNNKPIKWYKGITISAILKELEDDYPYAAAYTNKKVITMLDFDTYEVPDHAELRFIPLVVGG